MEKDKDQLIAVVGEPKESFDRIAWSSSQEIGGWDAYKHKQVFGGINEDFYEKRQGLKG